MCKIRKRAPHDVMPRILYSRNCEQRLAARIAGIAIVAAATGITGCYETAVIVATTAEENEKQDNPDATAIVAVAAEETTVVTAAAATVVVGITAATTAE